MTGSSLREKAIGFLTQALPKTSVNEIGMF